MASDLQGITRAQTQVEGKTASYLSKGEGEAVLYLHGFPTSGYLWRDVMGVVSSGYLTIAVDFPGFGHSQLLDSDHDWRRLSEWIGKFLDAIGLDKVHLAVHDWGGLLGLPWLCENPERVASLLVTDTSFTSTDRWHALAQQWREPGVGEESLAQLNPQGFASLMSVTGSKVDEQAVDEYFRGLETEELRAAKLQMYRSLDFGMFAPYMGKFEQIASGKSRVVWGANDPFVPAKVAHRFGERLGAEVTILEGAGHFLQEDAGAEVGRLHLEFLDALDLLS